MVNKQNSSWYVLYESVRGRSHKNTGNQDALAYWQEKENGPVILAIADGHGSAKCFCSEIGATLAVETAVDVVRWLWEKYVAADFEELQKNLNGIPDELVGSWKMKVFEHQKTSDIFHQRLADLESREPGIREIIAKNPTLPYGTTILVALVTEQYGILWQLGDGDILLIYADGEIKNPMPKDERLFANETTSLCQANAQDNFRSGGMAGERKPALIMLSTDGYSNSFSRQEGFLKVGRDYLNLIREEGIAVVEQNLAVWLDDTSRNGSGDDLTLGMIVDMAQFTTPESTEIAVQQHLKKSVDTRDQRKQAPGIRTFEPQSGEETNQSKYRLVMAHFNFSNKLAITSAWENYVMYNKQRKYCETPVTALAMEKNGRYFAIGHSTGDIYVCNYYSNETIMAMKGHNGPVTTLAFSPIGDLLVSGGFDNTIRFWTKNECTYQLTGKMGARAIAFSPNGQYLAVSSCNSTITVIDIAKMKPVMKETFAEPSGTALAFSGDNRFLVFNSGNNLLMWDIANHESKCYQKYDKPVTALAFSVRNRLAVVLDKNLVLMYAFPKISPDITHRFDRLKVNCVTFSRNGRELGIGLEDGSGIILK